MSSGQLGVFHRAGYFKHGKQGCICKSVHMCCGVQMTSLEENIVNPMPERSPRQGHPLHTEKPDVLQEISRLVWMCHQGGPCSLFRSDGELE